MQSVGQLYADICRSEPREMVITPFEEGWTSMIVVVVLSIIFASKRVSIDITVLMSSQESEAKVQFQSERATTVKPHRVTGCDTAATTFALPAFPSIESEIIANSLAIDSNEWSAERPLSTEIAPQLHLEVTNLEELVAVLVMIVSVGCTNIQRKVTRRGKNSAWMFPIGTKPKLGTARKSCTRLVRKVKSLCLGTALESRLSYNTFKSSQ